MKLKWYEFNLEYTVISLRIYQDQSIYFFIDLNKFLKEFLKNSKFFIENTHLIMIIIIISEHFLPIVTPVMCSAFID